MTSDWKEETSEQLLKERHNRQPPLMADDSASGVTDWDWHVANWDFGTKARLE